MLKEKIKYWYGMGIEIGKEILRELSYRYPVDDFSVTGEVSVMIKNDGSEKVIITREDDRILWYHYPGEFLMTNKTVYEDYIENVPIKQDSSGNGTEPQPTEQERGKCYVKEVLLEIHDVAVIDKEPEQAERECPECQGSERLMKWIKKKGESIDVIKDTSMHYRCPACSDSGLIIDNRDNHAPADCKGCNVLRDCPECSGKKEARP